MSSTNAVQIGLILEATAGTTPASPAFATMRTTGQPSLAATPLTVRSTELRSDRQITDLILVGKEAGGDIGMEIAFGTFDTVLEGALFNTWTEKATIVNVTADTQISDFLASTDTITVASGGAAFVDQMLIQVTDVDANNNGIHEVASSTGTTVVVAASPGLTDQATVPNGARIRYVGFVGASADITTTTGGTAGTITTTSLDCTTLGLAAGDWLKIGGTATGEKFATAANNGLVRVSTVAITSTVIDLDIVPASWGADNGSGKTIKIWVGDYIREGTTDRSYSIEQQFTDHSPVTYQVFTGMEVDSFSLQFDSQAVATANVTFVGRNGVFSETRTASATDVAANTNDILNTSSDVGIIYENGVAVADPNFVLSSGITISNAMRRQNAVGNIGSIGFGKGKADIQISLQTYFGNMDLAQKVIDNTATSFTLSVEDNSNNMYVFDVPRMKFADGTADVSGEDADVVLPLTAQAIRHATLLYSFQVQRLTYFEA